MRITALLLFLFASIQVSHSQDSSFQDDTLKILSYNVKMLPRIFPHLKHYPIKRARKIPKYLMADSLDIIILQEMFDAKARRILTKGLKERFPYMIGPGKLRPKGYKKGSGVMILSRFPFKFLEKIKYNDCYGMPDCKARKGVLLIELSDGRHTFQLSGTHMQAGGGKEIKKKQIEQAAALLKQFNKDGIPQISAGDFNIRNTDTVLFPKLLADFEATNTPFIGEYEYTSDHKLNDIYKYDPNHRNTVDYILYKGNGVEPNYISREIRVYKERYNKKHQDLSDHYAVLMKLVW